jgi:hypothetical protein
LSFNEIEGWILRLFGLRVVNEIILELCFKIPFLGQFGGGDVPVFSGNSHGITFGSADEGASAQVLCFSEETA